LLGKCAGKRGFGGSPEMSFASQFQIDKQIKGIWREWAVGVAGNRRMLGPNDG